MWKQKSLQRSLSTESTDWLDCSQAMGLFSQCCPSSWWRAHSVRILLISLPRPSLPEPEAGPRPDITQCPIFCQWHDLQHLLVHSVHWHWLRLARKKKVKPIFCHPHEIQSGYINKSNQYQISRMDWVHRVRALTASITNSCASFRNDYTIAENQQF